MLCISKTSLLNPGEILANALTYFGKGGQDLGEAERGSCRISFSGAGGFVIVTVYENAKEREV